MGCSVRMGGMVKDDKIQHKRKVFTDRARMIVPKFRVDMLRGRRQSIRVNTLKSKDDRGLKNPIDWAPHCYWFDGDKSVLTHSRRFS
jgi:hypothetical protein